jgi:hypothetical protein
MPTNNDDTSTPCGLIFHPIHVLILELKTKNTKHFLIINSRTQFKKKVYLTPYLTQRRKCA